MVIINVKLLSGFILDKSSLRPVSSNVKIPRAYRNTASVKSSSIFLLTCSLLFCQLQKSSTVKRVDEEDGHVIIYVDGVGFKSFTNFS